MAATNEKLQHAYDAAWIQGTPNSENCSGFLKSAGDALGFEVPNKNADGIIATFEESSREADSIWEKLGTGEKALKKAIELAFAGRLVIAAATSKDYHQQNGHVAILLPKLTGPHKAPLMYGGGSANARSAGTKSIREVWSPAKHKVVRFYVHRTALLGSYE